MSLFWCKYVKLLLTSTDYFCDMQPWFREWLFNQLIKRWQICHTSLPNYSCKSVWWMTLLLQHNKTPWSLQIFAHMKLRSQKGVNHSTLWDLAETQLSSPSLTLSEWISSSYFDFPTALSPRHITFTFSAPSAPATSYLGCEASSAIYALILFKQVPSQTKINFLVYKFLRNEAFPVV